MMMIVMVIMMMMMIRKIWEKLGLDRCTGGLYSGAAPLSHESMEFFKSIGLVVCVIYGRKVSQSHLKRGCFLTKLVARHD